MISVVLTRQVAVSVRLRRQMLFTVLASRAAVVAVATTKVAGPASASVTATAQLPGVSAARELLPLLSVVHPPVAARTRDVTLAAGLTMTEAWQPPGGTGHAGHE